MLWSASICPKNKYCNFDGILDNEEVKVEQCLFCGRKEVYRKVNGRIDNRKYLAAHVRDMCQSTGPTAHIFEEIYGHAHFQDIEKEYEKMGRKKKPNQQREEARDFYRTLGKSSY